VKTPLFLNIVLEGRRRGGQVKIGQMGAEKRGSAEVLKSSFQIQHALDRVLKS